MVSRAEHARRTITKLESKRARAIHPQIRRKLEARLIFWRRYLEELDSDASGVAHERERGA